MARHLTPDQRAAIVARYVETTNAMQVAREVFRLRVALGSSYTDVELVARIAAVLRAALRSIGETQKAPTGAGAK